MAPARRPALPPADEASRQHTRFPPDPTSLSEPEGRLRRGAPHIPVELSWALQSHVLDWRRRVVEVGPRHGETGQGPDEPAYFLTGSDPYGEPSTFRKNTQRQDHLLRVIPGAFPSVGCAPDRSWFEPEVLVTSGLSEEDAIGLATRLGQPAVVRWHGEELTLLPTGVGAPVERVTTEALVSAWSSSCPIRVDEDSAGVCALRGGPWTSSSIHAAALAQHHREVALTLVGCGVCEGGASGPGGAISLSEIVVSSRYGGGTWRR